MNHAEKDKRVTMSMKERSALGVAKRNENRRRERFRLSAAEMADHFKDVPRQAQEDIALALTGLGWTVTAPVDERKGEATTQPVGR